MKFLFIALLMAAFSTGAHAQRWTDGVNWPEWDIERDRGTHCESYKIGDRTVTDCYPR